MADILITGCSGGGKSSLLQELAQRGYCTVPEPGRRLIAAGITPWEDPRAFLWAAADMARADLAEHLEDQEPVFYDRGLIDALAGLERLDARPAVAELGSYRPYDAVFLVPPWPEIFCQDSMRRHDLGTARVEYEHLSNLLPSLGYRTAELPRISLAARADFVLATLGLA
ncbi:AAA family ATPase [Qipengyuania sp. 6B39]|uniref:AAA family ATPase n=1 Tax=Qipengyuania proteolytica TaxID=2867239 RepID=UPI001C890AD1|nr:AAA family ATPase [Qipengyuania proteolytica]MBX7494788.1 AAA family ATPase [Qipengyuania proteolytica]